MHIRVYVSLCVTRRKYVGEQRDRWRQLEGGGLSEEVRLAAEKPPRVHLYREKKRSDGDRGRGADCPGSRDK